MSKKNEQTHLSSVQVAYGKREEFFLFACVMEATMIDKRMGDRSLQIEVSCGNAGNTIDGQLVSASKTSGQDSDSVASANLDDGKPLHSVECFRAPLNTWQRR